MDPRTEAKDRGNGDPDGRGEHEDDEERGGSEERNGGEEDKGAEGIDEGGSDGVIGVIGVEDAPAVEDLAWDGAHSDRKRRTQWPSP
jgi:hypothetical protein